MSFERPWLLLALLAIPAAIGLYVLAERRRMRYAISFTNLDVLASVAGGRQWRRYVPPALFLLALAALCIAVARPEHKTLIAQDRATVILVVDVSRSMEATEVKPTRLKAAEAAVRTFLGRIPKRMRVGLIAFAGDPQVATPPTTDRSPVGEALNSLEWFPRYGGTAIGDALAAAVELGQQAASRGGGDLAAATTTKTHGLVSILLLSDGAQTRGDLEPLEGAQRMVADAGPRSRQWRWRRRRLRRRRSAVQARVGPGPTGSRDTPRDREHDRREVLRGAKRGVAEGRVLAPRLPPRPQARSNRDHLRLHRCGGRAASRRGPAVGGLVAAASLIRLVVSDTGV
jgi:hypothetical protein